MSAAEAEAALPALAELVIDAVDSGASIGFLPPLAEADALAYWRDVVASLRDGSRILLVASEAGVIQGAVQLALEKRANGQHRCEAMKLFVHRRARRRGIARELMTEAEAAARAAGCTLMLMDTRKGGEADQLCQKLGYEAYGEVPGYARSGNGELHTTVFYFRKLG
ncbi:MAG: GNAT family N-acetyltransferase [Acidobacteria bacterium]|nr:GNAT family N-acetyltransferase [Acidobacteriota bacterium]